MSVFSGGHLCAGLLHRAAGGGRAGHLLHGRLPDLNVWVPLVFAVGVLLLGELAYLRRRSFQHLSPQEGWARPLAVSLALTVLIICFGVSYGGQFIYFQF